LQPWEWLFSPSRGTPWASSWVRSPRTPENRWGGLLAVRTNLAPDLTLCQSGSEQIWTPPRGRSWRIRTFGARRAGKKFGIFETLHPVRANFGHFGRGLSPSELFLRLPRFSVRTSGPAGPTDLPTYFRGSLCGLTNIYAADTTRCRSPPGRAKPIKTTERGKCEGDPPLSIYRVE
jgi:hypothetical protein